MIKKVGNTFLRTENQGAENLGKERKTRKKPRKTRKTQGKPGKISEN